MAIGISSIGNICSTAGRYFKHGIRMAPEFVLGTGNEVFSKTLTDSFYGAKNAAGKRTDGKHFKNFWTQFKDAAKASEAHNIKQRKLHGGFFKNMWRQITTVPNKVKTGWIVGSKNAAKAGNVKWWGGLKGSVGALGKRLPLLGGLLAIGFELPNIIRATKEDGIFGGAAEAAKTATRVTAGMTGGAIGAALCSPIPVVGPIIGSVVGYFAGDALASLITGKSYSEKQAAKEESNQATAQNTGFDTGSTNPFSQPTMTPEQLMALQQQLYGSAGAFKDDFMAQQAKIYG